MGTLEQVKDDNQLYSLYPGIRPLNEEIWKRVDEFLSSINGLGIKEGIIKDVIRRIVSSCAEKYIGRLDKESLDVFVECGIDVQYDGEKVKVALL